MLCCYSLLYIIGTPDRISAKVYNILGAIYILTYYKFFMQYWIILSYYIESLYDALFGIYNCALDPDTIYRFNVQMAAKVAYIDQFGRRSQNQIFTG